MRWGTDAKAEKQKHRREARDSCFPQAWLWNTWALRLDASLQLPPVLEGLGLLPTTVAYQPAFFKISRIKQKKTNWPDGVATNFWQRNDEDKRKKNGMVKPIWISIKCPWGLRLPCDGESCLIPVSWERGYKGGIRRRRLNGSYSPSYLVWLQPFIDLRVCQEAAKMNGFSSLLNTVTWSTSGKMKNGLQSHIQPISVLLMKGKNHQNKNKPACPPQSIPTSYNTYK